MAGRKAPQGVSASLAAPLRIVASTMSAARTLGGWSPVDMMRRSARRLRAAFAAARCRRAGRAAPATAVPAAVLLQEFRNHILADHEVGQDHRVHLDRPAQDEGLHRAGAVGRRPSARRPAPVPASRCRTWQVRHARCERRRASPARRSRRAAAPVQHLQPFAPPPPADAAWSAGQARTRRLRDTAGPASRRTPPCGGGSRCGGCPAAPAAPAASSSRRFCSSALGRSWPICSIRGWPT